MQSEKPVKFIRPPGSIFSLNLHYSFQERVIVTKTEIKLPLINSLSGNDGNASPGLAVIDQPAFFGLYLLNSSSLCFRVKFQPLI